MMTREHRACFETAASQPPQHEESCTKILSLRSRRRRRLEGRTIVILLIMALALPLMACGKRALPQAPAGEPSTYPKAYPNPDEQK
jgi:predicted nucleic acid-binding Zn ribbon protein